MSALRRIGFCFALALGAVALLPASAIGKKLPAAALHSAGGPGVAGTDRHALPDRVAALRAKPGATVSETSDPAGAAQQSQMAAGAVHISSADPLSVVITDDSGATDDRIVDADDLTHTVTVSVKRGTLAVSGAKLAVGLDADSTTSYTTDAGGTVSFTVRSGSDQLWKLWVTSDGETVRSDVAALTAGNGVVETWPVALPGAQFETTTLMLYTDFYLPDWAAQGTGVARRIVPAGDYRAVLDASDSAGSLYSLRLGLVTVPDRKRANLSVDVSQMSLSQLQIAAVGPGDRAVQGARVWLTNNADPVRGWDPLAFLGDDGTLTVNVNPDPEDTYTALIEGGTPAVVGIRHDLSAGWGPEVFDFRQAPVLKLQSYDPTGETQLPAADLWLQMQDWKVTYYAFDIPAGDVALYPGTYQIEGRTQVTDASSEAWEYWFNPRTDWAGPWDWVTVNTGDTPRTFRIGGPVTQKFVDGPDKVIAGTWAAHELVLVTDTAQLTWANKQTADGSWHDVTPSMLVTDMAGDAVRTGSDWYGWWMPGGTGPYQVTFSWQYPDPYIGQIAGVSLPNIHEYALSLSQSWVVRDGAGPITATVALDGQPLQGVVVVPPSGSIARDGTVPVRNVRTDANGHAAFRVHLKEGGHVEQIRIVAGGEVIGEVPLAIADERHGIIQLALSQLGEPGYVSIFPLLPDGTHYDETVAYHEHSGPFYVVPVGTYGVVAASGVPLSYDDDYYVAWDHLQVTGETVTQAAFNGTNLVPLNVSAQVTDGAGNRIAGPMDGQITRAGLGYAGGIWIDRGVSQILVPGNTDFGLTFYGTTVDLKKAFLLMESGVKGGTGTPVSKTYNLANLARVSPTLSLESGEPALAGVVAEQGNAAAGWMQDLPGQEFFLMQGQLRTRAYMLYADSGTDRYAYRFEGRPDVTLGAGSNPGVWQGLGGPLTVAVTTAAAGPGGLDIEVKLTNAAGDRLTRVEAFDLATGESSLVTGRFGLTAGHGFDLPLDRPGHVDLPGDVEPGIYPDAGVGLNLWPYALGLSEPVPVFIAAHAYAQPNSPDWEFVPGTPIDLKVSAASEVESANLGLTFDPNAVSLDSGNVGLPEGMTLTVDAAGIHLGWQRPAGTTGVVTGDLSFLPKAGFTGETRFGFTPQSTAATDQGLELPAIRGLAGSEAVVRETGLIGSLSPGASLWHGAMVTVTDGIPPQEGGVSMTRFGGFPRFGFGVLPPGEYTVIVTQSGMLTASTQVKLTEGSTASLTPAELPAPVYGDLNNDGAVNGTDLNMLADHYKIPGDPFLPVIAPEGSVEVNLVTLALAARNDGATAVVNPGLLGSIEVTLPEVPASVTCPCKLQLGVSTLDQSFGWIWSTGIRGVALSSNSEMPVVTLNRMPPGDYTFFFGAPPVMDWIESESVHLNPGETVHIDHWLN